MVCSRPIPRMARPRGIRRLSASFKAQVVAQVIVSPGSSELKPRHVVDEAFGSSGAGLRSWSRNTFPRSRFVATSAGREIRTGFPPGAYLRRTDLKIIAVDNFNRETVADFLVCENVNQSYGERIVKFLNDAPDRGDAWWYRLVADDHRLSRGMEDLI